MRQQNSNLVTLCAFAEYHTTCDGSIHWKVLWARIENGNQNLFFLKALRFTQSCFLFALPKAAKNDTSFIYQSATRMSQEDNKWLVNGLRL